MNGPLTRVLPLAAVAALAIGGSAAAQSSVSMAGWRTFGNSATATNSSVLVPVPRGAAGVTAIGYSIDFTAINGSWRSDLIIRVEVPGAPSRYLELRPSSNDSPGTFVGSGDSSGNLHAGMPFVIPAGTEQLRASVHELVDDGGAGVQDARVDAGTLTITFGDPPPPFDPCKDPLVGAIGLNTLPMDPTSPTLAIGCGPANAADIHKFSAIRFTAPGAGRFEFRTCAQEIDTVIAATSACGDPDALIACNDDTSDPDCPSSSSSMELDLDAGETVFIGVGLFSTAINPPPTLTVEIREAAPPFDACAQPTPAVLGLNSLETNDRAGDLDMGTNCDMGTFGDEVNRHPTYLAFTAPRDAYYVVRTCDQDDDTRLSILTACGDASSVVACDDDGCDTESGVAFGSSAGFRATAGVTYFIGIGAYSEPGYEAPLRPVLVVDIAEGVPPADSCASPVAGVLGMNMLATDVTAQDLVMGGFCDMGEFGDEVNRHPTYIRFVPPQTRFYRARTCAQAADTRMSVLATCGEASSVLGCDDDACGAGDDDDLASSVTFQATAGVPVFIAVGAYSEPGYTAILPPVLAVEISEGSQPPPPLDPCDPSRIIAGQVGVTQVIPDPEYPNLDLSGFCSFPFGAPTLGDARYVSFTPSKTGLHVIGNCGDAGSTVDARLAVLEQCGVPASTVACDDDGCSGGGAPYTARIEVLLEAGKTYFVAVGRFDASAVGPFNIEISEPAGPPCPADLNGDGAVTGSDLGLLLGNWGFSGTGDLNGDGTVSGSDLGLLLGGWGACP